MPSPRQLHVKPAALILLSLALLSHKDTIRAEPKIITKENPPTNSASSPVRGFVWAPNYQIIEEQLRIYPHHRDANGRLVEDPTYQVVLDGQLLSGRRPPSARPVPIDLMLVVQGSFAGWVTSDMVAQLKAGISGLVHALSSNPENRANLVFYDRELRSLSGQAAFQLMPLHALVRLLSQQAASSWPISQQYAQPLLHSAILGALDAFSRGAEPRLHRLLVFTDGVNSEAMLAELSRLGRIARERHVAIDVIAHIEDPAEKVEDELSRLAAETNGRLRTASDANSIGQRFSEQSEELTRQPVYVVTLPPVREGGAAPLRLLIRATNGDSGEVRIDDPLPSRTMRAPDLFRLRDLFGVLGWLLPLFLLVRFLSTRPGSSEADPFQPTASVNVVARALRGVRKWLWNLRQPKFVAWFVYLSGIHKNHRVDITRLPCVVTTDGYGDISIPGDGERLYGFVLRRNNQNNGFMLMPHRELSLPKVDDKEIEGSVSLEDDHNIKLGSQVLKFKAAELSLPPGW